MAADLKLTKLTNNKWANMYLAHYTTKTGKQNDWVVVSRKEHPIINAGQPDAVLIIPMIDTPQGRKLVMIREFRVPVWDYEFAFPAGLMEKGLDVEQMAKKELKEETGLDVKKIIHISPPVYSSAGMSDESCCMVVLEACGEVSYANLEESEEIEVHLMDVEQIRRLLGSGHKIAAKAWGVLWHFALTGKIKWE